MANSSPDVKAMFNQPSYIQQMEEQDPQVSYSADSAEFWPLAPIVCSGYVSIDGTKFS